MIDYFQFSRYLILMNQRGEIKLLLSKKKLKKASSCQKDKLLQKGELF
jgi:hypothetical protein